MAGTIESEALEPVKGDEDEYLYGENCAFDVMSYMYYMFPGKYAYDLRAHEERQAALLNNYFSSRPIAGYHYALDKAENVFDICATPELCSTKTTPHNEKEN